MVIGPSADQVVLHRKACVCRRCKMNGTGEATAAKTTISRAEWTRLGKPSTIDSYQAALERESPPPPKPDMVTLYGSNRVTRGIAPRAKREVLRSDWERLGRPGTTHSYEEALALEKNGPPPPKPDVVVLRGDPRLNGAVALKVSVQVPRAEWERLGRPSTSGAYQAALLREKTQADAAAK